MRSFRPLVRRTLAIGAAALAGTAATFAFAVPASATGGDGDENQPNISAEYECLDDGTVKVRWTVTNDGEQTIEIQDYSTDPGEGTVEWSESLPYDLEENASLVGTQIFEGDDGGEKKLAVKWQEPEHDPNWTDWSSKDLKPCPTVDVESTCDDITFTITNPERGTLHVTLTPSVGDPVAIDLEEGETSEPVTFPGSAGLTVEVTLVQTFGSGQFAPKKTTTFTYEWEECPPTTTTPPATTEPSLPTTGSSLTGAVGAGAGLLLLGAGLVGVFFILRRRLTAS